MAHNNTLSVAISRDEDAQHDLILGFGTKGTIISGLSEADLLEIRSAIDCATSRDEVGADSRLIAAVKALMEIYKIVGVDWNDYKSRDEYHKKVLDVIAKATGGTRHA
jgi:hypothetical protein